METVKKFFLAVFSVMAAIFLIGIAIALPVVLPVVLIASIIYVLIVYDKEKDVPP